MNGGGFSRKKSAIQEVNSDFGTTETSNLIEWSIEKEVLLVEWADIAQCYRWLCGIAPPYRRTHA
jgi:hypothetical protein